MGGSTTDTLPTQTGAVRIIGYEYPGEEIRYGTISFQDNGSNIAKIMLAYKKWNSLPGGTFEALTLASPAIYLCGNYSASVVGAPMLATLLLKNTQMEIRADDGNFYGTW